MPKNAKKSVYKKKEFEIYVLWKSLPAHFRGMKKKELESSGFTDPSILKIIKIKNQTEFAKYFHIKDLGTLTDWNNKIKKENIVSPFLATNFKREHSNINQKIILPTIDKLEKKIFEQNKIVSLLKKENTFLKNKLKLHMSNKQKRIPSSTAINMSEIIVPVKPKINPMEHKINKTILQRVKNVFMKWYKIK